MRHLRSDDRARAHVLPGSPPGDGARLQGPGTRSGPHALQAPRLTPAPAEPLLVLLGPTGTGKSHLAVLVAERIGGEIIGCDALQVYRGFDAATAKPSPEDRERVRHWVVDVADPRRDYTLADYVRDADAAIAAIVARGRVPIVVGGTGMYLRGLLKGVVAAPARDERLRARLRRAASRYGPARLHRWLCRLDPDTAARVRPGDAQRIVRALELALAAGPTWSERLAASGTWEREGERYAALKFGVDLERAALAERLARRVDGFFEGGLVAEVDRLLSEGIPVTSNAFKAIGYREVLRARLDGRDPAGERSAIVAATRRYAKRQRTWFRKEPRVRWLDGGLDPEVNAAGVVEAWGRHRAPGGGGPPC